MFDVSKWRHGKVSGFGAHQTLTRTSQQTYRRVKSSKMVRPARFERATYRFVVCCSIQLS